MKNNNKNQLFSLIVLIITIILGAFLRFTGINWDQDFHLHPDERFLTMVETAIEPVSSLNEYFDTETSQLNPHNVKDASGNSIFPLFVYGTFPLFIVRYVAEVVGKTGYGEVYLIGRLLSGFFDLGTVVLIYLISSTLFKKKWLANLSALLYAFAVLPIQISHFFIVDNFTTFFSTVCLLAAIKISNLPPESFNYDPSVRFFPQILKFRNIEYFALFALGIGLAAASKINAIVIAILLPLGLLSHQLKCRENKGKVNATLYFFLFFITGIIGFIIFRIFQPYAFVGPGFIGILPNPKWIANMRELIALSSGNSNYPPSLQWARRDFFFPIKNLINYGLGLITGLAGFLGLATMGWAIIKGSFNKFCLISVFPIMYIIWQASLWNPTMRYFLIAYPFLVIGSVWLIDQIPELAKNSLFSNISHRAWQISKFAFALILVISSAAWAFAFIQIYQRPMTRIAASEWIYENVESAINLRIETNDSGYSQPLSYSHFTGLKPQQVINLNFNPDFAGEITGFSFDHIVSPVISEIEQRLEISLISELSGDVITKKIITASFQRENDARGNSYKVELPEALKVKPDDSFRISIKLLDGDSGLNLFGYFSAAIKADNFVYSQPIFEFSKTIDMKNSYQTTFSPFRTGKINAISLFRVRDISGSKDSRNITIVLSDANSKAILVNKEFSINLQKNLDFRGNLIELGFDEPITLDANRVYELAIRTNDPGSVLVLNGSKTVKETDWDDALPLYMYGMNPFDSYEGVYASDLNFQMYWDDNQEKLERFINGIVRSDYIFITSNRQWGSTTQIPERYPLVNRYYAELADCGYQEVVQCYREAVPGTTDQGLGFNLVKVEQSNPSILGFEVNTQYAEEAFTVYDHPKVLIFKKSDRFEISSVVNKLTSVDLDQVLNLTPEEAEKRPGSLMLGLDERSKQTSSGTWSNLFDVNSLINTNQGFAVGFVYLFFLVLGWIFFPLSFIVFNGLSDRGYTISRILGLLLWSLPVWVLASSKIEFSRLLILAILFLFFSINLFIYLLKRKTINQFIKQNWKVILTVEATSLFCFIFFLVVRFGNPDLWHPYKGGEKPMDFAYLNAVIKSTHFPPYDPWFAGGYINYYYYGFVLASLPIKLIGLVPSIAYNLILPTFFMFSSLAAFGFGLNVASTEKESLNRDKKALSSFLNSPIFVALISIIFVLFISNLGTVRMFAQGVINLGFQNSPSQNTGLIHQINYFFQGIKFLISGSSFNFYPGDWYWIPSRALPGEAITEFPYFTFLYGDPHAHLFAYPITILALVWVFSLIKTEFKFWQLWWAKLLIIMTGGIIIGSLRIINTWDYPLFFFIASIGILYKEISTKENNILSMGINNPTIKKIFSGLLNVGFLYLLTKIFYLPFIQKFGQAYNSIALWNGDKSPLQSYLVHWGFFLFVIISWILINFYEWAKSTRISHLRGYIQFKNLLILIAVFLMTLTSYLILIGAEIAIIVIPNLVFLTIMIIGKDVSIENRFANLIAAGGLSLTLMVEIIAIKGDIGRMNTVFKFYLQAWTLLGLSSAFFFVNIFMKYFYEKKLVWSKKVWITIFCMLLTSTFLFLITGTWDKVTDRMSQNPTFTLDGMDYMETSYYFENDLRMELRQDYEAIRWIQQNIMGTPVIIEANTPEYRWGNRYSIYTGLPAVVGWNWHQRQQRAINPSNWVTDRIDDVDKFYKTTNIEEALRIIKKYNIEYVIIGQLEKSIYQNDGLDKFNKFPELWRLIYSQDSTSIYQVVS